MSKHTVRRMWVMVVMVLGMLALAAPAAWAADFTVTNTSDSGAGSLRQAILNANRALDPDTIKFNIPGTGVHKIAPRSALPDITAPVVIDGYTQPGASENTLQEGNNARLLIELDGTNAGGVDDSGVDGVSGLTLATSDSTVRGLVINRFSSNYEAHGITIEDGMSGNLVQGNYIGTDATGTQDLGNESSGRFASGVWVRGSNNTIGGTSPGARNIISGNGYGVFIVKRMGDIGPRPTGNLVQGNYIGTDATGTQDLGNSTGVHIDYSGNNTIGGTSPGAPNIISGNDLHGVLLSNEADNIEVEGNYIGTDVTGTQDLGNSLTGISVWGANSTIGGTSPGARNIISGNDWHGVGINTARTATGNLVQGNYIGTDVTGTQDLGNSKSGVYVHNGSANPTIGGSTADEGNVIAFNDYDGVTVISPYPGIAILSNSVFSNGGLGIDLGDNGPTANDSGDADQGPNTLQNFPELSSVVSLSGTTTIEGTLDSTPGSTFTIQFFSSPEKDPSGHGEGKEYLDQQSITTDSSGKADFSFTTQDAAAGEFVSAAATTSSSSTSEFSKAVVVNRPPEAGSQTVTTGEDEAKTITLSATDADGDALSFEITDQPDHGTLGPIGAVTCEATTNSCEADLTYTPEKDHNGSDSFSFLADDGIHNSSEVAVSIEVTPVNDTPVAQDDSYSVEEGESLLADVLANDFDADNDALTPSVVEGPAHGTLTPKENGTFEYVPGGDYNGEDSFTYKATDGTAQSNVATVTITVKEANQMSLSGAIVTEGNSGSNVEALLHVRLSKPAEGEVKVAYATEDDAALSPQDYEASSGTLTFSDGEAAKTIAVSVKGDTLDEPTENFFLNLSGAVGSRIADGRAAVTIRDDDEALSLSVDDVRVIEPTLGTTAEATFTVSLSAESGKPVSAEYVTSDGTAKAADGDYSQSSNTVYFKPGITERTVSVLVRADTESESEENFFLNLSGVSAENASLADGEGEATIEDSLPTVLRFRPTEGSTRSVRPAANVVAAFSKEMDPSSVNAQSFYLQKDDSSEMIPAAVSYDATYTRAILNPDSKLTPGASYTATVKGGVEGMKDLLGKELASGKVWSFTVTPDQSAPSVVKVSPSESATGISPAANVAAVFSEAMDATTITEATFKLYKKGDTIALGATVTYETATKRAELDPTANLERGATYKVVLTSGAKDLAGNALDQNPTLTGNQQKVWFFTIKP